MRYWFLPGSLHNNCIGISVMCIMFDNIRYLHIDLFIYLITYKKSSGFSHTMFFFFFSF